MNVSVILTNSSRLWRDLSNKRGGYGRAVILSEAKNLQPETGNLKPEIVS